MCVLIVQIYRYIFKDTLNVIQPDYLANVSKQNEGERKKKLSLTKHSLILRETVPLLTSDMQRKTVKLLAH